jgi:2-keto-3-deoxygluconate permease
MLINSIFPGWLTIGSFTTALFSKSALIPEMSLFMLCLASQIDTHSAKRALGKGVTLLVAKVGAGAVIGIVIGLLFGRDGILGISVLAIVPAMTNSNDALYAAIAQQSGNDSDAGAVSVITLNNGPLFSLIILGAAGMANVGVMTFVPIVIPVLVGFLLGNLDKDWRSFLSHGHLLIPFMGFSIGASLKLHSLITGGWPGLVLGLAVVALTGGAAYLAYGIFPDTKRAIGAAVGSTAGVAATTPAVLAGVDKQFAPYVQNATVQIAASVLVTAILCPLVVSLLIRLHDRNTHGGGKPMPLASDPEGSGETVASLADAAEQLTQLHDAQGVRSSQAQLSGPSRPSDYHAPGDATGGPHQSERYAPRTLRTLARLMTRPVSAG